MPHFLDLPREVRDNIYRHVVSSRHGVVRIYGQGGYTGNANPGTIKGRLWRYGAPEPERMDISLLCVNKAVSAEALACLYSANAFHPASPLSHFVAWLRNLTEANRLMIRKLDLPQRLFMPLLFDNTAAWEDLETVIGGEDGAKPMELTSVSISVPLDVALYEPGPAVGLRKLISSAEHFWWPQVKFFVGLLMQRKVLPEAPATIWFVRINLPTLHERGIPESHVPILKPLEGPNGLRLDQLDAIRYLRIPRVPAEDKPEELGIFEQMKTSGMQGRYTRQAWVDYHAAESKTSREPWDFHAHWKAGNEGEVIILD